MLQVSVGTVRRDWSLAQAWLFRELTGAEPAVTPERHRQIGELYHAALAVGLRRAPGVRRSGVPRRSGCCGTKWSRCSSPTRTPGVSSPRPRWMRLRLPTQTAGANRVSVGQRIAHYEVLARLGAGGMGVVYLVEDTRLGRRAALKLLARDHDPGAAAAVRIRGPGRLARSTIPISSRSTTSAWPTKRHFIVPSSSWPAGRFARCSATVRASRRFRTSAARLRRR